MGDKQGSIVDYSRAISIDPNDADSYYNRGNAKSDLGQKQAAIADFIKAAELYRFQGRVNEYQQAMAVIAKLKGN